MDIVATRQRWTHGYAFVLAATASAVGLGNIWKFPYILGQNGGGAFLAVYLLTIALIGIPIMMAEVMIGRRGRRSPGYAALAVAREARVRDAWQMVGWIGIIALFVIMTFYAVVTGWVFSYVPRAASGAFAGVDAPEVTAIFQGVQTSLSGMLLWTTLGLAATFAIVALGLRNGLERGVALVMPLLFVLLLAAMAGGLWVGDIEAALDFMFRPDFSALDRHSLLIAVGHAFFTMTLAAGVLMMFGAYLPRKTSIAGTAIGVAIADTVIALIAGVAIFPVVFGYGLDPAAGPGLMFEALPLALSAIPAGVMLTTLFFAALSLAAFSTMIANVQVFVHLLHEHFGISNLQAALGSALAIWGFSLITIFSFTGAGWAQIDLVVLGRELPTLYHLLEHTAINILLPVSGLLIALFAGWVLPMAITRDELGRPTAAFHIWRLILRYIAPIALLTLFWQLSTFSSHLPMN
ncbi:MULTISPECIES: sodium-dependent transporter [unclassified Thioalkalivibrio]|uniref:sodium-dependent transporter n=1 Tax=unclassified Thioalkalivibrio TaxID=2621013 RepID=UPI00036B5BB1|nr:MULTISPECIES: sodium-dependent transporter [unclassified Thioalkalivibrio]